MGQSPLRTSFLFGAVLQVVMVVIGAVIPALGARNNFYPILGTIIAALAGARFSRWSPGVAITRSLSGGARAGGGSSLIGALAAAIAAAVPAAPAQTILIATLTGTVAGMVGGVLGRGLPARGSGDPGIRESGEPGIRGSGKP
jgi:hypothetical protein